jgi:hypothetical protein
MKVERFYYCLADLFLELGGVEGGAAATTSDVVAIASPANNTQS